LKGSADINGLMVELILAFGKTTKWMGLVYLHGLTEESIKDNIPMIRRKVLASSHGQMDVVTMVFG